MILSFGLTILLISSLPTWFDSSIYMILIYLVVASLYDGLTLRLLLSFLFAYYFSYFDFTLFDIKYVFLQTLNTPCKWILKLRENVKICNGYFIIIGQRVV